MLDLRSLSPAKLVVVGNRLYAAAGKLYVLDITNPAAPAVLGPIDLGGNLGHLAIAGADDPHLAGREVVDAADRYEAAHGGEATRVDRDAGEPRCSWAGRRL